jgi:hypothetical protein
MARGSHVRMEPSLSRLSGGARRARRALSAISDSGAPPRRRGAAAAAALVRSCAQFPLLLSCKRPRGLL